MMILTSSSAELCGPWGLFEKEAVGFFGTFCLFSLCWVLFLTYSLSGRGVNFQRRERVLCFCFSLADYNRILLTVENEAFLEKCFQCLGL